MTTKDTVQYRVTGAFSNLDEGEITEAIILLDTGDGGSVLLYHPKTKGSCGSIEMCHLDGEFYVSSCQETDVFGWVNVEGQRHLTKLAQNLAKISYNTKGR